MRFVLVLTSLVAGWSPVAWVGAAHATGAPDSAVLAEACYWLAHAEVGRDASYQPGVDAYGRDVAPADLSRHAISVPDVLDFDITVDLADDLPPGSLPTEANQRIAHITLNTSTGEMWVDGEPIGRHDDIDLETRCPDPSGQATEPTH